MEKKVRVVVRVRPQLVEDKTWVKVLDEKTLQTINHRNLSESLQYEFSHVFDSKSTQEDVYKTCVAPLLSHTLNGQNASVLAYGPTGTGKTHTIQGSEEAPGIIPRTMDRLFRLVAADSKQNAHWNTAIFVSYIEIYNEKVQDLLAANSSNTDLPLRMGADRVVQVAGVTEKKIDNPQHFHKIFSQASKNRTVAATRLNERSSRSHCLLVVRVERRQTIAPHRRTTGKIHLIDLAGSEDNRRTGNKGVRLKESGAINTSLLALGQVVNALNKGQNVIPYRDSKLTRLLQDSLGGNSHACMIVNLAPEERHYYDTFATLNFACRTKKIVNTITTNESTERQTTPPVKPKPNPQQHVTTKRPAPDETPSNNRPNIQPFLSPLIRNQEKFKADLQHEVMSRLERLEERLVVQMQESNTQFHSALPTPPADRSTTDNTRVMDTLDGILSRLKDATKPGQTPLTSQAGEKENAKPVKRRSSGRLINQLAKKRKLGKVFSDGSSPDIPPVEVSASPLFKSLQPVIKRKGKSTAAPAPAPAPASAPTPRDPSVQKTHNERTLSLLNSGSVKELMDLQTVGTKRAKLIHDYRSINGDFSKFEDLLQVPGVTEKYLQNFLRSNLVQLSV